MVFSVEMPQDLLDEVHQFCEEHPTIPGALFTVSIRYGLIITFRIQREVAKVTIGNVTIAQGMPIE